VAEKERTLIVRRATARLEFGRGLEPATSRLTEGKALSRQAWRLPFIRCDRAAAGHQQGRIGEFYHHNTPLRRPSDRHAKPCLLEYQVREVVAYILSLRK
jgi:hypothetical protein